MEGYAILAVSPTTKTSTGRVTIVVHSRFSHCILHVRSSQRVMITKGFYDSASVISVIKVELPILWHHFGIILGIILGSF
eukprot:90047-Amphidinium_carterae.1